MPWPSWTPDSNPVEHQRELSHAPPPSSNGRPSSSAPKLWFSSHFLLISDFNLFPAYTVPTFQLLSSWKSRRILFKSNGDTNPCLPCPIFVQAWLLLAYSEQVLQNLSLIAEFAVPPIDLISISCCMSNILPMNSLILNGAEKSRRGH